MLKQKNNPQAKAAAEPKDSSKTCHTEASRRQVLRNLTLAGFAVSSATAVTAAPAIAQAEAPANNSLNYRETEHVRRYYALSRR